MASTLEMNKRYHVISCSNGQEVLNYINLHPDRLPDLFVLDIWLPDIDGDEIARVLRENAATTNRSIILISAVLDAKTAAEEVGADDYLSKPFQIEELELKVAQLMQS
jgi:two-component system alkaline phosphatase synthesis response regulator PhoP